MVDRVFHDFRNEADNNENSRLRYTHTVPMEHMLPEFPPTGKRVTSSSTSRRATCTSSSTRSVTGPSTRASSSSETATPRQDPGGRLVILDNLVNDAEPRQWSLDVDIMTLSLSAPNYAACTTTGVCSNRQASSSDAPQPVHADLDDRSRLPMRRNGSGFE
jgi:hypothetical protein